MPDYGFEFTDLSKCVEFLDSVLRNLRALRMNRDQIDAVYVTDNAFTVFMRDVPDDALQTLQKMLQARSITERHGPPPGQPHTINALLERVMLVHQPQPSADTGLAIALFDAGPTDFRDLYTQLLNMGCHDLRVGFVESTPKNSKLSYIILVGRPSDRFSPPTDWARNRGLGGRTLTLCRLRADERCPFYIEWGYEHPVPGLDRLYQATTEEGRGIFVFARALHEDRVYDETEPARKPQWVIIPDAAWRGIFHLSDEALNLEPAQVAPRIELQSRRSPEQGVLEFRVQRDTRGVTSLESIESQIAWHQQAIEDLQRDYRTAHALRREPIYLAYVFEQFLDGDNGAPPSLSTSFSRLLDQPYNHLSHFHYGFYDHPSEDGQGLHVVLDTRPSSYTQVWTQPAAEVYIQRQDWHEANLPLFVRDGDTLQPRLEDEAMLALIRRVIWDDREHPHDQPVLLRTRPRGDNTVWEALYLSETLPLTDASVFRFLHERFPQRLLQFRRDLPDDLASQWRERKEEVHKRSTQLHTEMAEAVKEELDAAETEWRRINDHLTEVLRRARQHEEATTRIEQTVNELPDTWDGFVGKVLESDKTLLSPRIAACTEYQKARSKRDEQIREYEKGLFDVKTELQQDLGRMQKRRSDLARLDTEVAGIEEQLKTIFLQTEAKQREVQDRVRRAQEQISQKLQEQTDVLNATKAKIATLQAEVARLQTLENDLAKARDEQQQKAAEVQRRQQHIEQLRQQIQQLREETARLQDEVTQAQQPLEQIRNNLVAQKAQCEREAGEQLLKLKNLQDTMQGTERSRMTWQKLVKQVEALIQDGRQWDNPNRQRDEGLLGVRVDGELPGVFLEQLRKSLRRSHN